LRSAGGAAVNALIVHRARATASPGGPLRQHPGRKGRRRPGDRRMTRDGRRRVGGTEEHTRRAGDWPAPEEPLTRSGTGDGVGGQAQAAIGIPEMSPANPKKRITMKAERRRALEARCASYRAGRTAGARAADKSRQAGRPRRSLCRSARQGRRRGDRTEAIGQPGETSAGPLRNPRASARKH
jgi:hypothetical protein